MSLSHNFQKIQEKKGIEYYRISGNNFHIAKNNLHSPIIVTASDANQARYVNTLCSSLTQQRLKFIVYDLGGLGYGVPFNATPSKTPFRNLPAKPDLILHAAQKLPNNRLLIWMDADTVPIGPLTTLGGPFDICLSLRRQKSHLKTESWINSGVLSLYNNKDTRRFLKLWGAISKILGGDQYALNEIFFNTKNKKNWPQWMYTLKVAGAPAEKINNFYFDSTSRHAIILHFKANVRSYHPAHLE